MGIDGIAEMAMRREEAKWMNGVYSFVFVFTPGSEIALYVGISCAVISLKWSVWGFFRTYVVEL